MNSVSGLLAVRVHSIFMMIRTASVVSNGN